MGIEPKSEAWEVLNISIPFSSQRHAATSSVNQSKQPGHAASVAGNSGSNPEIFWSNFGAI